MSRDKQIEEMAKDFDTIMQRRCFHISCNECEFDPYDTCKATMLATALINDYGYCKASDIAKLEEKLADVTANWQKIHDAYDADCIEHYNKGRSDSAEEIFAEIEDNSYSYGVNFVISKETLAELKKKHTEEKKGGEK